MRTVLVTEVVNEAGLDLLRARPDIRLVQAAPGDSAFEQALPEAEAIGVRILRLDESMLHRAACLRVVSKHGVGTDNIPVGYLTGRGVPVAVTIDANAVSVAEHTMMLMLAAAKRLHAYEAHTRRGEWAFRDTQVAVELSGRTVLVVGFGRIARRVAALCQAFGMAVIVHDVVPVALEAARMAGYDAAPDLDCGLAEADVVTLHLPRTDASAGLFDAARLGRMRPDAILVNCARGGIVDEAALVSALIEGRLGAAGLDVFDHEPLPAGHKLTALPNVVLTPHSAAMTQEGARGMSLAMARNILDGLDGTLDRATVVNPAVLPG